MTDRFLDCLHGFTWLPAWDGQPYHVTQGDKGGPTSMGVTLATYAGWRRDHGIATTTTLDLKNAPLTELEELYRARFWLPVRADLLPLGLDLMVFDIDIGVGSGPGRAARILQAAVGVTVDGYVGPVTLQAVARVGTADLLAQVTAAYLTFLAGLEDWELFGKGWANRAAARLALARKMAGIGTAPAPAPPAEPAYETDAAAALRYSEILERLKMLESIATKVAGLETVVGTLSADLKAKMAADTAAQTELATLKAQIASLPVETTAIEAQLDAISASLTADDALVAPPAPVPPVADPVVPTPVADPAPVGAPTGTETVL